MYQGCPEDGASEELAGFFECGNGSTSEESGSTCAFVAPNATEQAPTPGNTLPFVAYDATKGGVDEEEAAQSYLAWAPSLLRSLVYLAFALAVPRRSSSAMMGAAWRSSVVGYLLFSPEIARVAATSVRGSDNTIAKSSNLKIKINESPSSSDRSIGQRRVLSGYAMTDSNIRTAVAAWLADASAAETTYGHISTWETSG